MISFLDFITVVVQVALTLCFVGALVAAVLAPWRSVRRFAGPPARVAAPAPPRGGRHRKPGSPPGRRLGSRAVRASEDLGVRRAA